MDILAYIEGKSLRLYALTDDGTAEVGRLALTDVRPDAVAAIVRGLKGMLAAPPKAEPEPTGMLALLNGNKAAPQKTPRRAPGGARRGYVSQADVLAYVREIGTDVDSWDVLEHFPQLDNSKAASNKLYPLMKAGYLIRTQPGRYRAAGRPIARTEKAVALITEKPTVAKTARRAKQWAHLPQLLEYVRANPGQTYGEIAAANGLRLKYVTDALRTSQATRLERQARPMGQAAGSVPGRVYINEGR